MRKLVVRPSRVRTMIRYAVELGVSLSSTTSASPRITGIHDVGPERSGRRSSAFSSP